MKLLIYIQINTTTNNAIPTFIPPLLLINETIIQVIIDNIYNIEQMLIIVDGSSVLRYKNFIPRVMKNITK